MKIGVLASGAGTNLQAIINLAEAGILDVSIELVLVNRPEAAALTRAQRHGLDARLLERGQFPNRKAFDLAMVELLKAKGCEAVILAGYMLVLGKSFIDAFPERILNIHPALLPSFPGTQGISNAKSYGVKLSGPTVHFVGEEVDSGPIIIQGAVPVSAQEDLESLRKRIHAVEYRIFPQAIQWLSEGRLSIQGRTVFLKPGHRPQLPPDGQCFIWPPLEEGF